MSIQRQDLCAVLGVTRTAQISHAYRTLLHAHHPDTHHLDTRVAGADAEPTPNGTTTWRGGGYWP